MSEDTVKDVPAVTQQQEVLLGLPFRLAQSLVDYFVQRPYRESAAYIDALRQLQPVVPEEREE